MDGKSEEESNFIECSICLEKCTLPYKLECSHVFCFLCLKRSYESTNRHCPLCRSYITKKTLRDAQLSEDLPDDEVWMYAGRHDGFWVYDPVSQEILEKGYQEYLNDNSKTTIQLEILGKTYDVNFETMMQNYGGLKRKIKRDIPDDETKGMAGLKIN